MMIEAINVAERRMLALGVPLEMLPWSYCSPRALRGDVETLIPIMQGAGPGGTRRDWHALGMDARGRYTVFRAPYQIPRELRGELLVVLARYEGAGPVEDFVCDASLVLLGLRPTRRDR